MDTFISNTQAQIQKKAPIKVLFLRLKTPMRFENPNPVYTMDQFFFFLNRCAGHSITNRAPPKVGL